MHIGKCSRKKVGLHSLKAKLGILKVQQSLFIKKIMMMVAYLLTCQMQPNKSDTKGYRKNIVLNLIYFKEQSIG